MNPNLALLILSWQVACLYHETETEKLLPGSTSATEAESDTLDAIHDEVVPDVSWDEFNDVYASYDIVVRPVVFLKSDISITGGDGSSTNPYTLG